MSKDNKPKVTLTDGSEIKEGFDIINPLTGMQKDYIVLSKEERDKGFIRPLRYSYIHVGLKNPKNNLRDLTEEEKEKYNKFNYVKFEEYGEEESPVTGRYWTQKELDKINNGCGGKTTIGNSIAETYAHNPKFYGSTFCAHCKEHFPVGENGEFIWDDNSEQRVGT